MVCGLLDFMTPAFTQYEIAGLAPKVKLIPIAAGRDQWINWRLLAYLPLPIYKEGKVRLLFKWALCVKKVYFGGVLLLKERCLAVWQLNCLAPIQYNPITFITLGTAGGPKSCKPVYIGKVNYVDTMFSLLNDETIHLCNPQCMANLPLPQQTCATSWKASQFIICNSRNQMLFSLLQNHPEMLATTTPPPLQRL